MCYMKFIDLGMLGHPCIFEMKPTWSWSFQYGAEIDVQILYW